MIQELNDRSREIFRILVDEYVATGEPVGSRTISRRLQGPLSAASVRNVMADLAELGLLSSPHASAGRIPTEPGLRLFVESLLQVGDLSSEEREAIEGACEGAGRTYEEVLGAASALLSGLSQHAGVVVAPKQEAPFKHVEFVSLAPDRALVIVVLESGAVENRVIDLPPGITPAMLTRAGNYLSARLAGRTLDQAQGEVNLELTRHEADLVRPPALSALDRSARVSASVEALSAIPSRTNGTGRSRGGHRGSQVSSLPPSPNSAWFRSRKR